MDRTLEAHFRRTAGDGWQLRLVPDGTHPDHCPWRDWFPPDDPQSELFLSIVPRDRHPELHAASHRLRVRPEQLDPRPGPMPPVLCWPALYDARGHHVFRQGWTLAEMCAPHDPDPWPFDGSVTVVGDPALAATLRTLGVPTVHDVAASPAKLATKGTVAVIASPDADVAAWQRAALTAQSPLVVWLRALPPAAGKRLLEVVPTGTAPREPDAPWIARLMRHLRAGHAPELALTLTASESPPADLRARWLRGTLRPWPRPAVSDNERLRYWRYEIDRWRQEKDLGDIVDELVSPDAECPIAVVVVPGAEGAGLEFFRRRPLALRRDGGEPVTRASWEPPWSDAPADTLDKLCEWVEVDDASALVQHLVDGARGSVLLAHVNHPVAPRSLTVDALRRYVTALRDVADGLVGHPVRLLVMAYVVTDTPDAYRALERESSGTSCAVSVLKALDRTIPDEELEQFLTRRKIVRDHDAFVAMRGDVSGLDYESLVAWLANHYAEKLSPW